MVRYPVSVPLKIYHGANETQRRKARDRNSIAKELATYVNTTFDASGEEQGQFLYSDIARATGYDIETVRDVLFAVDCGHNALSVFR